MFKLKRRTKFKILAALIGLFASLVFVELVLRVFPILPDRIRNNRVILTANVVHEFENPGFQGIPSQIRHSKNNLGFRGPDCDRDKLPKQLSIVMVGGSTTEDSFLPDGSTWVDHCSNRLEQVFEPVWVNNAGINGHSTFGHQVLVQDAILPLDPKVIVYLVGVNDIRRDDLEGHERGEIRSGFRFGSLQELTNSLSAYSELANLLHLTLRQTKARVLGLAHKPYNLKEFEPRLISDDEVEEYLSAESPFLAAYKTRLSELVRLTQESGSLPVLVTQPLLVGPIVDPTTGGDLATYPVGTQMNGAVRWQQMQAYNDVTRDVANKMNIPLIELADEMPKDSRFYFDTMHYSMAGAERVGEIVADQLIPILDEHFHTFRKRQASAEDSDNSDVGQHSQTAMATQSND